MAAINFPDSPTVNDLHSVGDRTWIWTGEAWEDYTERPNTRFISDTAPAAPLLGDQWYKSDTGQTYLYYDGFWVEQNSSTTPGPIGATGPTGTTISSTEPTDQSVLWIDESEPGDAVLPLGGTTGQALLKASDSNYDTEWSTLTTSNISDFDTELQLGLAGLVDSAPSTLDTLNELAAALGDDPNFATTVTNSIATKAPLSNPTFTGTVTAGSFSGAATGLTGTASSLTANALGGGTNITTYVNMSTVVANTDTNIARLDFTDGMYAIYIHWDAGYIPGGGNLYWSSSYAGIAGIASAQANNYFNSSPAQQLIISGTQHHRNAEVPTFWMKSDNATANYGNLCLFIRTPSNTNFLNLQVVVKRLF